MKLKKENGKFVVMTENDTYRAISLIIATGGKHRELGVEGEKEFLGRGVSYCATCDGHFFKGKKVLVVGGGNSAVEDALYLKDLGCDVILVHRRDELRAEKALQEELFKRLESMDLRVADKNRPVERVACDLISSMTDRYALYLYEKIFFPSSLV